MNVLRLAIVDPDDASRDALKSTLLGMDMIWLEAECSRYEFFADVIGQTNPHIGVVVMNRDTDKALELVARLHEESPNCSVLVVSASNDGDLILRAMRAGAKEFLVHPVRIEELLGALGRISERRFGQSGGKLRGSQVIAVAGVTGGVGVTSIAVNLGCALAQEQSNSVALVDLDLCLGDADILLDIIPDYTLVDVAQNVTRLDFTLLKRSLANHPSGLCLLPRPVQLEDIELITPDDLQRVIGLMKATFTHLVLDLSKGYSAIDSVALEMADQILLITQLDLPCLRNIVRLMASFDERGIGDKVRVVVNRADMESGQITLKKAKSTIGKDIFYQLPNDYRTMIDVRNNGVPLIEQAPKAAITQAIMGLADMVSSGAEAKSDEAEEKSSSKSGIGRLLHFWSPQKSAQNKS